MPEVPANILTTLVAAMLGARRFFYRGPTTGGKG